MKANETDLYVRCFVWASIANWVGLLFAISVAISGCESVLEPTAAQREVREDGMEQWKKHERWKYVNGQTPYEFGSRK